MRERKSGRGESVWGNPNALLALVTVAGGLWLVTQKLTSNRPVIPSGTTLDYIGDQKLESRLWEDPYKSDKRGEHALGVEGQTAHIDLADLAGQVERRSGELGGKTVLILPVMIAGGQYSEDQESRIRSRYAIVSALGRAGYAPEDAEHIGAVRAPWLSEKELDEAFDSNARISSEKLWEVDAAAKKVMLVGREPSSHSPHLEMRYEWYRPRSFAAGPPQSKLYAKVLVLWLDDTFFEHKPLLRLALALERLIKPNLSPSATTPVSVALIGPRRSSTLRAMLPDWDTGKSPLPPDNKGNITALVQRVWARVDVFCPSASAMDEVLVRKPDENADPRVEVGSRLKATAKLKSFQNLTATDSQMAAEVVAELNLRGVDLVSEKNHVVLISEWDTFYARMLSLTYEAQIRTGAKSGYGRPDFVESYILHGEDWKGRPPNFHSFVYLRGLDGQTVGSEDSSKDAGTEQQKSRRSHFNSVEDLEQWEPDINKAEGPAQFDYLGRTGDQIEQLEASLRRDDKGELKAIGIVGSDVYDTLLILQALRRRFPHVWFFTTDLDVRFLHPRERAWARNLIVVSSYGLALHHQLQGTVAPFRDSVQTAQFAATLAALGNKTLGELKTIPPRRFEVGNSALVDLSMPVPSLAPASPSFRLHPLTPSETYWMRHSFERLKWAALAIGMFLLGATWVWRPLRRLTWESWAYPAKALEYTEEDVGGPDGAEVLLLRLAEDVDEPFARWLIEPVAAQLTQLKTLNAQREQTMGDLKKLVSSDIVGRVAREKTLIELDRQRDKVISDLKAKESLVTSLNYALKGEVRPPSELPPPTPAGKNPQGVLRRLLYRWPRSRGMMQMHRRRDAIDDVLDRNSSVGMRVNEGEHIVMHECEPGIRGFLTHPLRCIGLLISRMIDLSLGSFRGAKIAIVKTPDNPGDAALAAAVAARDATERIFRLRCRRLVCFWIATIIAFVVAALMFRMIWADTHNPTGEVFSLTSGTSAWPAELVRLSVIVLAICFAFGLSHKLRETFLALTREFRLSPLPAEEQLPTDQVCAQEIWQEYKRKSRFRLRVGPIVAMVLFYLAFLLVIKFTSAENTFRPLRGQSIASCDLWLRWLAILGFLFVAFITIDAARLCREFIEKLSASGTRYPEATRRHFSQQMGGIDEDYLDEWIDLQLIADLTERVGRLVYYPAILVFLLLLSRYNWWDCWTWPTYTILIFIFNFVLSLASVVILQRSAKEAKAKAEKSLEAKVKRAQARSAPTAAQNTTDQAQQLLEEIRDLNRGAFVPFWENPVVGAIFGASGGTTILQLVFWLTAQ